MANLLNFLISSLRHPEFRRLVSMLINVVWEWAIEVLTSVLATRRMAM